MFPEQEHPGWDQLKFSPLKNRKKDFVLPYEILNSLKQRCHQIYQMQKTINDQNFLPLDFRF